nr:Transmembrane protein [Ipomoea batatas]GME11680.1 Transmembrane protein [Ipomoea batatas]
MEEIYKHRGGEWKQSSGAPPLALLAIFSIVIFLLSLSHYSSYKDGVEQTMMGFRVFAYLLPLALLFLISSTYFRFSTLNFWNRTQPRPRNYNSRRVDDEQKIYASASF